MGFEPTTPTLARLCSTPELHPQPRQTRNAEPLVRYMAQTALECNRLLRKRPTGVHSLLPELRLCLSHLVLSRFRLEFAFAYLQHGEVS